jgi:cytosine/adenosine deaminase-related metal-dependent hydrolase
VQHLDADWLIRADGDWMMAADLLVQDVRPFGGDPADILILGGRIVHGPAPSGVPVLDGGGRIALPGLVEAHTHLDKSLLGLPWYRNEVGPRLIDKIENERNVRKTLPIDPRQQSERQALLSAGVSVIHMAFTDHTIIYSS